MNRPIFFNMKFSKIFFIIFLSVIVRQCESNNFIYMKNMILYDIILNNNWEYPVALSNPTGIDEFCNLLNTFPTFTSSDMANYQSNFVQKTVPLTDETDNQRNMKKMKKRYVFIHSIEKGLPSISCIWNDYKVYITKNESAEKYLLYFNQENQDGLIIDEPLALILQFLNMYIAKRNVKKEFQNIVMKQIHEHGNDYNVWLSPWVRDGQQKLTSSSSPNYQIFIIQLCASSFLHTLGAEEFKTKKIEELKLDVSIDEVSPNKLGINIKNGNDISLTVVNCTCNELINFLLPHLEDKEKLFIVSLKQNNEFSYLRVSLDFPLNTKHIPDN